MKTNLLNFDLPGLTDHFREMGEKPFRAKQVMRWMHQAGAAGFDEMTDLAKSFVPSWMSRQPLWCLI